MRLLDAPSGWSERLVIVADVEQPDIEGLLTISEVEIATGFRLEKRRREWTSARAAAKLLAVRSGLVRSPLDCFVVSDGSGKPELRIGELRHSLSLSHSAEAATALIGAGPVGVDLQEMRRVDRRAAKFFLRDEEPVPSGDDGETLIQLWAAKEAAWKASGAAGSTLRSIQLLDPFFARGALRCSYLSVDGSRGSVETFRVGDRFVLAIAEGLLP